MDIISVILQFLALIGLLAGILMFWSVNKLDVDQKRRSLPFLSIIIPARNEALRLAPLLLSLNKQRWKHFEVIVVDDGSTDHTSGVARAYGAKVLKSEQVGEMEPGKANALAYGARFAKGEWLLFLDADVRFETNDSLEKILVNYDKQGGQGILSLQPYHRIKKPYENLSALFNIIVLTGINVFTVWQDKIKTAGSFGPSIVCDQKSYVKTGGHEACEQSIMEDFALSDLFIAENLPVTNYLGRGLIQMRMYEEGIGQLIEGWVKNLATASQSTDRLVMRLIQLWIFGVIMVTIAPFVSIIAGFNLLITTSLIGYVLYGIHLYILARRAGNFNRSIIIIYPLHVLFFTSIFLYSFYRTHVVRSVNWRGRKIKL